MTLNFWSSYLLHAGITNLSHHDRFMLGGTDSRALRKQGKGSTTELHLQSFVLFLSFFQAWEWDPGTFPCWASSLLVRHTCWSLDYCQ